MQSDLETVKHLIRVISFHGISGRPLEGSKPLVGHAAYIYILLVCVSLNTKVYIHNICTVYIYACICII